MTTVIEMSASDWERADNWLRRKSIGAGDRIDLAAQFAEHREAAFEAGAKAMQEAAIHKATSFLVGDPLNGVPLRSPSPHEIADAIAALDPAQIAARGPKP